MRSGPRGAGVAGAQCRADRGVTRTARTLARLNQWHGFDCPGCTWPQTPGHRKPAEFWENGATAVAEGDHSTGGSGVLRRASGGRAQQRSDYWLTHPMIIRPGNSYYAPIS